MHNSFCYFLLVVVVFFSAFQEGTCLKCFSCSSPFGGYCDELSDKNPVPVEECLGDFPWCYHFVHNVDAIKNYSTLVQRGCSTGKFCESAPQHEPVTRVCFNCDLNLCNNATLFHQDYSINDEKDSCYNVIPSLILVNIAYITALINT